MTAAPASLSARPTMQDVAACAGVHKSTVSLALRRPTAVAPTTLVNIQRAVASLGYRRDPWLDAFNFRRVHAHPAKSQLSLAFITEAGGCPESSQRDRLSALRRGVEERARIEGWHFDSFKIGPGALPIRRLNSILRSRRIDGVILSGLSPSTHSLELDWNAFRAIGLETFHLNAPIDIVTSDLGFATRQAVQAAVDSGARRVGLCLTPNEVLHLASLPIGGYRVACRHQGMPMLPEFIAPPVESDALRAELGNWLKRCAPDAVVVFDAASARFFHSGLAGRTTFLIETEPARDAFLERVGATAFELLVSSPPIGSAPTHRGHSLTTIAPPPLGGGPSAPTSTSCESQP